MNSVWEFVRANPELVIALVLYVVMNVAPRPHPDDHEGWRRIVWLVLDRRLFLPSARPKSAASEKTNEQEKNSP
jgi:hypothetical protein